MAQSPTQALAQYVASADDVPAAVRQHAAATFTNFVGCAVGGSRHEAIATASRALLPFTGGTAATVIGRGERADPLLAAQLNGMSAAVYSFDDTHAEAVVHPGGPVGCALLALAEARPIAGRDFLLAYALGIEVACRVSKAVSVSPAVNEPGWVQTGITAGLGAAAAVGKVLGLDATRMAAALGIAVCQAGGVRALARSMCFSLMAGQAAQAGLRAALLAQQGFTAGDDVLESDNGFLRLYSKGPHPDHVTAGLGERFELLQVAFKPYPCGVVIHPAIDAGLELAGRGVAPERIEGITVKLAPASVRLVDTPQPRTVQEGQSSVQHWVAAALADGAAGLAQGRQDKLADPRIAALRARIRLQEDPTLARDAARVELALAGGDALQAQIDHCRGSADRPLTQADLGLKFRGLCAEALDADDTDRLLGLCERIATLDDVAAIARAAAGSKQTSP
ncbi:MAG TPA: MmgE/PrpD family protein [Ramlibacter sp.]|nr:MmgE/PrpD family protein [Ramlibacter sp.]